MQPSTSGGDALPLGYQGIDSVIKDKEKYSCLACFYFAKEEFLLCHDTKIGTK